MAAATARDACDAHWAQVHARQLAKPPTPMESARLRVLVLSYEFTFAPFSGNGVLARSLVKGLLAQEATVFVLCCRPGQPTSFSTDVPIQAPEVDAAHAAALDVEAITLSAESGWRRLDRSSAWQ